MMHEKHSLADGQLVREKIMNRQHAAADSERGKVKRQHIFKQIARALKAEGGPHDQHGNGCFYQRVLGDGGKRGKQQHNEQRTDQRPGQQAPPDDRPLEHERRQPKKQRVKTDVQQPNDIEIDDQPSSPSPAHIGFV